MALGLHTWWRIRPSVVAATIYLHWTATGYDWIRPGRYHRIIGGDGRVHRLHALTADLPAHTWRRNSNSVALACACMGGQPDPWTQPPQRLSSTASAWRWRPLPAAGAGALTTSRSSR